MKIAFIGGAGHHYLRPWLKSQGVEGAVASDGVDRGAAERLGKSLGVNRWYDDARVMLDEFKPDVLSVGAVYGVNGYWCAEGMARGIPVVSDKPVASTWEQWRRLQQLALNPAHILITEFDFRTKAEFLAVREAIQAGEIGKPILVTAQKSYKFGSARPEWYSDRLKYGGTVLWVASHSIDVIQWVTSETFTSVTGRQGNLSQPEYGSFEDHVSIVYEMANGGTAMINADFLRPAASPSHADDRLRIAGTKGVLEVMNGRCKLLCRDRGEMDITDCIKGFAVHEKLMEAARGNASLYSTKESIECARVLLKTRDAVDRGQWIDIGED